MSQLASGLTLCLTLLLMALPGSGQSASFDCAKAQTWVEQALCDDATLGVLDERMADAYRAAREAAVGNEHTRDQILASQRDWLALRNRCATTICLKRVYESRIQTLTGDSSTPNQALGHKESKESGPHYEITTSYPIVEGSSAAAVAANREIRAVIDGYIVSFRKQLADMQGTSPWQGPDWSLAMEYAAPHQTDRYLAIPFSGYEYTGGAHGMPLMSVLMLDPKTGQRVPPADLFSPGSDWLQALSQRCLSELKTRDLLGSQNSDWLLEGTAPKPENYQLLFPGPDGLTVTFPPYSVAPYAAGIQEVLIPYSDLAGILNPHWFAR